MDAAHLLSKFFSQRVSIEAENKKAGTRRVPAFCLCESHKEKPEANASGFRLCLEVKMTTLLDFNHRVKLFRGFGFNKNTCFTIM